MCAMDGLLVAVMAVGWCVLVPAEGRSSLSPAPSPSRARRHAGPAEDDESGVRDHLNPLVQRRRATLGFPTDSSAITFLDTPQPDPHLGSLPLLTPVPRPAPDPISPSPHPQNTRIHFPTGTEDPKPVFSSLDTNLIVFPSELYPSGRITPVLVRDLESNLRVAIYVPSLPCTDPCEFRTADGNCAADFQCEAV